MFNSTKVLLDERENSIQNSTLQSFTVGLVFLMLENANIEWFKSGLGDKGIEKFDGKKLFRYC